MRAPDIFLVSVRAVPIHAKDYPSYQRLAWCIDGKGKGVDVGWFAPSAGFFGVVGQRAGPPLYQENIPGAGAEWAAVSNQFFTTLIAPLTAKASSVWGKRFDVDLSPTQKVGAIEGAMGMPGFQFQPGQTNSAHFKFTSARKFIIASPVSSTTKPKS